MRKHPLKHPNRNSLQKWFDREASTPLGLTMMEDFIKARTSGKQPADEVMEFFELAFTEVLKNFDSDGTTDKKGRCLVKSLGFSSKRGKRTTAEQATKNMNIAVDCYNGMKKVDAARKYDLTPPAIADAIKTIDQSKVGIVAEARKTRALEIDFLNAAYKNLNMHLGEKINLTDLKISVPSELPIIDFSNLTSENQVVITASIALIQSRATSNDAPINIQELTGISGATNRRMSILAALSECFNNDQKNEV